MPYDPTISFLGVYLDKTIIWKDTCTSLFITTLFTIAKTWKQSKCPSIDEWIDVVHIYSGLLLSHKKELMPFAARWMDSEIIMRSEVSQTKTNILWYCLYVESKKNKEWYKWTHIQDRNRPTDIENKLVVTKGERGKGSIRSLGLIHTIVLCIKWQPARTYCIAQVATLNNF